MPTIEPDYWAAGATVAPVLAFAIILEGKSTLEKLENSIVPLIVLYVLHGLVLIGLGISVNFCFQALRGVKPEEYWTTILESSVSNSVVLLIIGPGLAMLFGSAHLSAMKTIVQLYKVRIFFSRRKSSKLHTSLVGALTTLDEQKQELRRLVQKFDDESDPSGEKRKILTKQLDEVSKVYENARGLFNEYPSVPNDATEKSGTDPSKVQDEPSS